MNILEEFVKSTSGQTRETLEQLVRQNANLIKEQHRSMQLIERMSQDIRLLRKRLFGTSSEKQAGLSVQEQEELNLFNEFELCAQIIEPDVPADDETDVVVKKRKGRKPLPKHLERILVVHDLSEEEKECTCGTEMECIGHIDSEQLHYRRAEAKVIVNRRKKYGCTPCNELSKKEPLAKAQLKTASKPLQLIPKSIASASLLAQIAIQKFCDHLPLYRQEQIFKRLSIDLSRQTMSEWMLKVGKAVIPLTNLMQEKIIEYDVAFADETTLQVLREPGRRAQSKSYIWCFMGGPPSERIVIYQYHPSRSAAVATQFFEGYKGALHCDGYNGYTSLIKSENIVGINCMAHARRKFVEALPNGKMKGVSGQVVRIIAKLYKIEAFLKARKANMEEIKKVRFDKAKPILKELKAYLVEKSLSAPPKSKVGLAISYTLKRWPYLITYLLDGRYEIDNNRCERAIKPFVMGRKAWLFSTSVAGAHASAQLFSLIETAKANNIDPDIYLNYLFTKLPYCKTVEDYENLLPWNAEPALSDFKEEMSKWESRH